jgi:hypothetical protein
MEFIKLAKINSEPCNSHSLLRCSNISLVAINKPKAQEASLDSLKCYKNTSVIKLHIRCLHVAASLQFSQVNVASSVLDTHVSEFAIAM